MHLAKKGLRILGIAESFTGREISTLAGIVFRRDWRVDGFSFADVTVGGMDATTAVLDLYRSLGRRDINLIMLSGCVISWYNIIDPQQIVDATSLPVIVVTYEPSSGIEEDIIRHFPGDRERLEAYHRLTPPVPVSLNTGYTAYIRNWGLSPGEGARICRDLTLDGRVPEPLRLARLLARSVMRYRNAWR
ncbi:MAG: endonuclease dU [Methanoculleaceae archaeon]